MSHKYFKLLFYISFSAVSACQPAQDNHAQTPPVTPQQAMPVPHMQPIYEEPAAAKPKRVPVAKKSTPLSDKTVMGYVEYVELTNVAGERTKAKLDSGADTTSLDAEVIKIFKRDGKRYVLFRILLDGEAVKTLERKVKRFVRIKSKQGKPIRRPVVDMSICLGGKRLTGEVNLSERTHFEYSVLIGRNMLKGHYLIDSGRKLTSKPECE